MVFNLGVKLFELYSKFMSINRSLHDTEKSEGFEFFYVNNIIFEILELLKVHRVKTLTL